MTIEAAIEKRLSTLAAEAQQLRIGNQHGGVRSDDHQAQCSGWMAAALNVAQLACPNPKSAYWLKAQAISEKEYGYTLHRGVAEMAELLKNLQKDIEAGLLTSIADRARAETFDNFLDHGRAYLKEGRAMEAGVIGGVVFEDTLRRVCRKHDIEDKDVKLDTLISALVKIDVISDAKAKRARVAAHVRTKATHAQWGEFDAADVAATIEITQELVNTQLDE
jgi:hypothetical protein